MIGVRKYSSCWQFVIAYDVGYSLGFSMVPYSEGSSHLLPEVFNFQRFESSFNELVDTRKNVLFPVLE